MARTDADVILATDLAAEETARMDADAALDARVILVETNSVLDLGPYVSVDVSTTINSLVGANVHIRNGSGSTVSQNGLGNLVVGYNEEIFSPDRTGSHNLVVGKFHAYSNVGGFVAGSQNTISGPSASVSGGQDNVASAFNSSVSGGFSNEASGENSIAP